MIFGRVHILTQLARLAVGGLFIFSGFIKANDPVGFSYKLEEYFEVFDAGFSCDMKVAGDKKAGIPCVKEEQKAAETAAIAPAAVKDEKTIWHFFAEHSLLLAIVLCGAEIVLGLFLLLGFKVRWTLWLLLAMIVFFSFLTFYSACCNKVTSCGCFGDAIKLTPWESFWKDLILLILIAVLFAGEKHLKPLFKNTILTAGLIGIGTFLSFAFPVYTWQHLPVIDFRPYKIGTHILTASKNKDPKLTGCVTDSFHITYYLRNTLVDTIGKFEISEYPSDSIWEYYCRHDELVRKGNCNATIGDFSISNPETGEAMNDQLFASGIRNSYMLVMYDIEKADLSRMKEVNAFAAACAAKNIPFYALSSASAEQVEAFRKATGATYPMYTADGTALKTVVRSNPGLVQMYRGVVLNMWHINDFPAPDYLNKP
ncbi:MAG: hypothetical protein MUC87_05265 [Bacteroidia bacterium]|nr:hypothetical protein [Bacteroidia bacterium]